MRTVKEIEVVTCDGCGYEDPPNGCASATIDGRQWDVCGICLVKLQFVLGFLTIIAGLDIQYSLGSLDSLEARDDAS